MERSVFLALLGAVICTGVYASEVLPPVSRRFAASQTIASVRLIAAT